MMKSKHFLFHYLLKQLPSANVENRHLLVAVSGGVDSMTLLSVLLEVKNVLNFRISVVHVHHGSKNEQQRAFQDQAVKTVEEFCIENNIFLFKMNVKEETVYTTKKKKGNVKEGSTERASEAEMRKSRYQIFSDCIEKAKVDYLVLAHTADDLLETRLIRLIRGTGEQGLMAMSFKRNKLLRPLIHINRAQIVDYAKKRKLIWCEDPSNQSMDYSFRNWIRREWLPQLEKKRPGSVATLSRSLDLIAHGANSNQKKIKEIYQEVVRDQTLRRDLISVFPLEDTKKILAYYIKNLGFKNYRSEHIMELVKQMNRPQKSFTFSLLGRTWKMSAQWLQPCGKK